MTLLNDKQIAKLAENDIFLPFVGEKRRELDNGTKAISFGLSQAGYDIRLSSAEFLVFKTDGFGDELARVLDPKDFQGDAYQAKLFEKADGSCYFLLPPHSNGLGISLELISMPNDVLAICQGKSTYARLGLVTNTTPAEPGWSGHFTMCFINPTDFPIRLYANEGVAQFLLIQLSGNVEQAYKGAYQNQKEKVTLSKVGSDYRNRLGL
jgi:dCTP deaminase